ncbi:MAG: hypothetical protein ACE37F_30630 [Nannocystaceae bacterium]|nr:hypothetical protein [bacterium]
MLPGQRVLITRRCHDRRLFLSPHGDPGRGHIPEETENFFGYTLARATLKYGVEMHAGMQMGNHLHLSITDVHANRPNFKNSVHSNLARGLNARFGRFDSVWNGSGSCDTVAPSDEESLEDLAYADCNPVTSGLVKWAHLWPGFTTYGWKFGESRTFTRPDWYYDSDNCDNPETITLTRIRPPIYPELSDDELFAKLMKRCLEIQHTKQAEYKEQNRRFMGLKKLAKTKWWKRARSWEDRFTTIPRVAASTKQRRIAQIKRDAQWQAKYAEQRANVIEGRPAKLPAGAYFLPTIYGVPVEKPP